ncbi:ATP-grasp fold amidoligase family protein [Williamsia sp. R60]
MRHARWRERSRLVRWWRLAQTRNPETFTEKVRYKMLRDHRDLVVTFADKVAVRELVGTTVGTGYLPAVYATVDDPERLLAVALPRQYVVKPSHGSGAVVVVSDAADPDMRLPDVEACWSYIHVRPEHADRGQLTAIARYWLQQLYGQGPNREWAYGHVPRRVLIEELLMNDLGNVPDDYKFFVFHGRCEFIQVDTGRFGRRTQNFYRTTWTLLPLSGGPPPAEQPQAAPACLDEMIIVAEKLAASTDFVRVDLYVVDGRVVFGELTNYPAGGESPFHPESFDREFGRTWQVPKEYVD